MFVLGGLARRLVGGAVRGVGRAIGGGRGGGSGGWKDLMRELGDDHRSLGENLQRNSKSLDIQLGIEGRGFRELAGALPGSISRGKSDLMRRLTLIVEAEAKRQSPVRTGNLRRTITSRVEQGGDRGIVGTNARYARAVHDGRGPVVAKGKALRFKVGKQTVYRKRVGPAKGNPFMERAMRAARPQLERELKAWGDQMLSDVARKVTRR
jgi:hypothetical protein